MIRRRAEAGTVLAGIAVVALALAGCSSSSSPRSNSPATSTTASTSVAPQPTGSPIKIGLAISSSGLGSQAIAPSGDVATAWADWVNDTGGIGGHPVDIDVQDTGGDPVNAIAIVKKFVSDKVVAVILEDPSSEGSVGQYLEEQGMPVIGADGFATNVWSALPNFFSMVTYLVATQQAAVVSAKAVGVTSIAVVACAELAACSSGGAVVSAEARKENVEYEGQLLVSASAPNYTAQCLDLVQKNVGAIFLNVTSDVATRVVADCQLQGFHGQYIYLDDSPGDVLDTSEGAKYVGALNAFPWWVDDASVKQYMSVLNEYAPKVDPRGLFETAMWSTLELFRAAVGSNVDNLTAAKVMEAYDSLKGETLHGLLPQPMTYTVGKPAPKVTCFWIFAYTAGKNGFTALHQGPSGNGATDGLRSSCLNS